jgi:predicted nucleic acid-binding protein
VSIYLDTSAMAKLVIVEAESAALRSWLRRQTNRQLVTNSVGAVELARLTARVSQAAVAAGVILLGRIDLLELTAAALALAGRLPPPEVRTLDALHVASAAQLADLRAIVTYDQRMATAATGYGLAVETPGRAVGS